MRSKVRDIVGTGEGFKGSLARAIGCTPTTRMVAEFDVLDAQGKDRRVCKQHLAIQIREDIVNTGMGVMVIDAVTGGECEYEQLA